MTEHSETLLPEIFDPATQQGNDLIPVGTYVAQVIEACVAQPQSGDGYYIALTWQITEGEHENRYIWQRITFLHSKAQAAEIGRKQFKDLCVATGINEQVSDVEVFKYIPCDIKVGVETDKRGEFDDKNKVSRIWPLGQAPRQRGATTAEPKKLTPTTTATATTITPRPAASSANGTMPPWHKQKPTLAEDLNDEIPI
jgi:Protein of unknown function (DUF669)